MLYNINNFTTMESVYELQPGDQVEIVCGTVGRNNPVVPQWDYIQENYKYDTSCYENEDGCLVFIWTITQVPVHKNKETEYYMADHIRSSKMSIERFGLF